MALSHRLRSTRPGARPSTTRRRSLYTATLLAAAAVSLASCAAPAVNSLSARDSLSTSTATSALPPNASATPSTLTSWPDTSTLTYWSDASTSLSPVTVEPTTPQFDVPTTPLEPAGPGSEQAPSTVTATWPANPSATCYSTPSLNDPNQFGVAFGFKDGESNVVILDNYVTACRESLTRQGWLPPGADVSTCLKKDDTVGIFPGEPAVCGQVGLPVAVAG